VTATASRPLTGSSHLSSTLPVLAFAARCDHPQQLARNKTGFGKGYPEAADATT
jgi:hypothetical protein